MSDVEGEDDNSSVTKKGKKKYYPFGTPNHKTQAYSQFAHIKDPQTQIFATKLSAPTKTFEAVEPVEPERIKRAPTKKSPSKASTTAPAENPAASIPDAEGLEPCTKIPCQLVLRAMADILYRNEVERDEIEDDYDRMTQELEEAEQEMRVAEQKLLQLNDVSNQLETRYKQLADKVEQLEKTKDAQNAESSEINNKVTFV
jgi:hypothetical protein